jgi:hypothetical protein
MKAWMCAALVLASCQRTEEPPPVASAPTLPARAAPASPVDASPPDAQTLKGHMREHFAAISELQRAIARGHLDEAKQLAAWLGSHDETLLDGWKPYVDELKTAAAAMRDARDLPSAAALAGKLARSCSKCHEARSATVAFAWAPAPEDQPVLVAQMKRHQWAASRMWEGLVGPSEDLWDQGTRALATTQLDLVAAGGSGRGDVTALAQKVRELANRGSKIIDHDERAAWYGELLSTCAGCHALVRPTPVP